MKPIFSLLIMMWFSAASWAQKVTEQPPLVVRVDGAIFSTVPNDAAPYTYYVTRSAGQPVKLMIPSGGTGNSVDLYLEKDYNFYHIDEHFHQYAIKSDVKFMAGFDKSLVIDLSSLVDGNYIAMYSSCSRGGTIRIAMYTE